MTPTRLVRNLSFAIFLWLAPRAAAQDAPPKESPSDSELTHSEQMVAVTPLARDDQIERRIRRILEATGWFSGVEVTVEDGIAFLDGATANEQRQVWARDLAAKTSGVVAVVNHIGIEADFDFTFAPAVSAVEDLARRLLRALPSILLAVIVLPLAWVLTRLVRRLVGWSLRKRMPSTLLTDLVSRLFALPVLLLGIYVVLQAAGLTQLAVSLVGGAGVLGIVLGFAFRDIGENFLASLLLSVRRPFRRGDFITVAGQQGLVHSMNTRSTVLVSPEGNHIQIPNSMVFKSIIENFTAVANRRGELDVGISNSAAISDVQGIIRRVLEAQEGVLAAPEPMVLADALGASLVSIKVYYWFDGEKTSPLKLKSLLIQRTKQALTDARIAMPGEVRELIFPQGIPGLADALPEMPREPAAPAPAREQTEVAERDLTNETEMLEEQLEAPIEGDKDRDLLAS